MAAEVFVPKIVKPEKRPAPKVKVEYPFEAMEVGDTFFVPSRLKTRDAIKGAIHYYCKRHAPDDRRFKCTAVDEGYEVTRVA